jgi:hypothetical protein
MMSRAKDYIVTGACELMVWMSEGGGNQHALMKRESVELKWLTFSSRKACSYAATAGYARRPVHYLIVVSLASIVGVPLCLCLVGPSCQLGFSRRLCPGTFS